MRRRFNLSMVVILALVLTACATSPSLINTTYDLLAGSKESYDTSMRVAADLYAQGELTLEQKQDVLKVGKVYHDAHNAAVEALASYAETGNLEDQERLEKQIAIASSALSKIFKIVRPYLEED